MEPMEGLRFGMQVAAAVVGGTVVLAIIGVILDRVAGRKERSGGAGQ